MGMDVYGKNPTSEKGSYFRANVWYWRPIWTYCETLHDDLVSGVSGHYNDGDGLGAKGATELGNRIKAELADGTAKKFHDEYYQYLAGLERPACDLCQGTGIRSDQVGIENKMPEKELQPEMAMLTGRTHGWCNACNGEGKRDNFATNYPFDLELLGEFADFLVESGGFRIC